MNSGKNNKSHLSRDDVSRYSSTTDERLKHQIEKNALESDFDADALDGWSETKLGLNVMNQTDKTWLLTHNQWVSKSLGFVLILVIAGGLILYLLNDKKEIAPIPEPRTVQVERTDVSLPQNISELNEAPKEQIIKPTEISRVFKQKNESSLIKESSEKSIKSELKIDKLTIIAPDLPETKKELATFTAKEVYFFELKLIDYRAYRSRPVIQTETMTLTGVPADKESEVASTNENGWKETEIIYIDYLKRTTQFFSEGNYKTALNRYNTILEKYPDDVNALFYSGLCYYNLNEYSRAQVQFHETLISKYDNFYEEAEWLLAKSYWLEGQTEKAKAIFTIIAKKNGYYANEARKMLK